jgi:hypothetical protein
VLWHAERDRYRTILASCPARNFVVYDVRYKSDGPTNICEMRGEAPFKYHKVGEAAADDGEGGGFVAVADGIFDNPPSPSSLAFIACRLAATGR